MRLRKARHPARFSALSALPLAWLLGCALFLSFLAKAQARGLPFTRSYSWEEIGVAPKNARLYFDRFGRLCLLDLGVYVVLNDTTWENILDRQDSSLISVAAIASAPNGQEYIGGRGFWGVTRLGRNSLIQADGMVPPNPPAWVTTAFFDNLIPTSEGIYLGSWEGFVYHDFGSRQTQLFELPNTTLLFNVGQRVFVASRDRPVQLIAPRTHSLAPLKGYTPGAETIELAAPLNDHTTLLSRSDGRLMQCDGQEVKPWSCQELPELDGNISAMRALPEGGAAIAATGKGLFILDRDGHPRTALTTPLFHHIISLAANEPGVLWMSTDHGVSKILYGEPLSTIGLDQGLPVNWPIIVKWKGRITVATSGKLYVSDEGRPGFPSSFRLLPAQPKEGIASMVCAGDQLLIGNKTGVYVFEADGGMHRICDVADVGKLVLVGADCFVIGRNETAALKWNGSHWVEFATRGQGLSYTPIVHGSHYAAWVEMGPNGVARISVKNGALQVTFPTIPWHTPLGPSSAWTNVGVVGERITLCASTTNFVVYNDRLGEFCEAPDLEQAFRNAPYWILRMEQDSKGRIWGMSEFGVTLFTPRTNDLDIDAKSFDLINEHYPRVYILPGDDVWISTDKSLHHVETYADTPPPPIAPVLISVVENTGHGELLDKFTDPASPLLLPYRNNNLTFRFFSGSYAWKRPPAFQIRTSAQDPWSPLSVGNSLNFQSLPEGRHSLEIRTNEGLVIATEPFYIMAPWYHTWAAYALFTSLVVGTILGVAFLSSRLVRRRNRLLEALVSERTTQLESTMLKLNDETRHAATLAERNRLAGEIHDSVQQGLSGAILQLDSMLEMPAVRDEIRTRMTAVRNMVSFSRHEVQHAVWDLESPLLDNADLGEALRKLAALINTGSVIIDVQVSGPVRPLGQEFNHNLLRIAQEATTNAVKHAKASVIDILLQFTSETLTLEVVDNGVGFSLAEADANKLGHLGMEGMKGRARRIGGKLKVLSTPGTGTRVLVSTPLPPSSAV